MTTEEVSDTYWNNRPRQSQIAAWASQQSRPVADRSTFLNACKEIETRFDGQAIPRPPHWGGYQVSLERIEFWQERDARMHERTVYTRGDDEWNIQRLYP